MPNENKNQVDPTISYSTRYFNDIVEIIHHPSEGSLSEKILEFLDEIPEPEETGDSRKGWDYALSGLIGLIKIGITFNQTYKESKDKQDLNPILNTIFFTCIGTTVGYCIARMEFGLDKDDSNLPENEITMIKAGVSLIAGAFSSRISHYFRLHMPTSLFKNSLTFFSKQNNCPPPFNQYEFPGDEIILSPYERF